MARPTWGSLFEPRHKQNLYANPKRTAKSFNRNIDIDLAFAQVVQNKFLNYFFIYKNSVFKWAKNQQKSAFVS